MIRSRHTMPRSGWGTGCDAWELVATPGLSVKHERMPAGTREVRHYHEKALQFFFVLSGALTLEKAGHLHALGPSEGLLVEPGIAHQALNAGSGPVEFLVISNPPTVGDRFEER